ncbi:MAG: valine--tRNA ligase, partial [Candidatus Omnitrophota bacterium]
NMEISTRYNPADTEDKWYRFWEKEGYFCAQVNPDKDPFCIVIPPPNVTGVLHMGHALNNTIQDILIRYHRMKGKEVLWMPGTDHAGIATQNVVERELARQGLKREDVGREKFIQRIRQWKEEYGSTIIHQLKKLGASCDWSRTRFTMDDEYSIAVREVFAVLWHKGLIYQDNKVINWCPRCQTALSDEEAPHQDIDGQLYYIKYPLSGRKKGNGYKKGDYIVVATTRPETMLGDTAVAVNPKDRRYKKYIGGVLILPLINRSIKVIADSMVDKEFGTGAVKVTPAHDPNDYILGKKHKLDFINIMHSDGRLNESAGNYKDMGRFEAREAILRDLKEKGLLEKVQPHKLSAGHCYRCNTIIEPTLSRQWFVKMKPLAKRAIQVVKKGRVRFHPKRWMKVYLNWMENIEDWCISRQIWWGHRLPIYYCKKCTEQASEFRVNSSESIDKLKSTNYELSTMNKEGVILSKQKPEKCPYCGSADIYQETDVLDTWFSSWLWPFATFYWPPEAHSAGRRAQSEKELKYFYPTSVLVTAPEILFFWVARMIMAGLEFMNDIPFSDVYIHGTVRDIKGRKMSKSLGNAINPLEIIKEYGADALRFCLTLSAGQGDLFLSREKFEMGRNFANKIWNASRFVLMNLDASKVQVDLCVFLNEENLEMIDRWILSRFYSMLKDVNRDLDSYHFNGAAGILYAFFWHEFCDWYLEIAKANLGEQSRQVIMYKILEKTLRILHPFMPFITEEIWHQLPHTGQSIMIQPWPHVNEQVIDKKLELEMGLVFDTVKSVRNLRIRIHLKPNQTVPVSVYPYKNDYRELIKKNAMLVINLAGLEKLDILDKDQSPQGTISDISKGADIYLHFGGLVDIDKEQRKIKESIDKQTGFLKAKKARVKNKDFVKRAPKEVVEKEKEDIREIENTLSRLEQMQNELQ